MNKIFKKNRFIQNSSWLIGGKVFQSVVSLVVGALIARFLGPTDFGIINYVSSFIAFFTPIATLGLNNIIVNEIVSNENKGSVIGTALVLRFIASFISMLLVTGIVIALNPKDKTIWAVAIIQAFSLLVFTYEILEFWFQYKLISKYPTIIALIAYVAMTIFRIVLLVFKKNVIWFAVAVTFDYVIMGVLMVISYKMIKGPKLFFSKKIAKDLLKSGYNFILSGLMVAVYTQTDKIMLKEFIGTSEVGIYSVANSLSMSWGFILNAIIISAAPIIFNEKKIGNNKKYVQRLKQLYCGVLWISIFISIIITGLAGYIITIIYGKQYINSILVLQILTWCTGLAYIGVAKNIWIVAEAKEKYVKFLCLISAILNICLNILFIPRFGAAGAAIATLITQFLGAMIVELLIKQLRKNAIYVYQSLIFKGILWDKDKNCQESHVEIEQKAEEINENKYDVTNQANDEVNDQANDKE